jgi:hypothetical protein
MKMAEQWLIEMPGELFEEPNKSRAQALISAIQADAIRACAEYIVANTFGARGTAERMVDDLSPEESE